MSSLQDGAGGPQSPEKAGCGSDHVALDLQSKRVGAVRTTAPCDATEEMALQAVGRYERALRAIRVCDLMGADFAEWVRRTPGDVLEGFEAECWRCETDVHDGPCVED